MQENNLPEIPQKAESPEEENSKKAKKREKRVEENRRVEGFLVPEYYRNQSVYKNHPVFRITLLIIILGILAGSAGGYEWLLANKLKKTVDATQRLELAESTRLQNQTLLLKGIKEKYKELDILRKQLRIPLAPILDSVEKTIPKELSINDFSMTCPPLATSNGSKRRATVRITVFFPDGTDPNNPKLTAWPELIASNLLENGLKSNKPEWGPQKQFILPKTRRSEEIKGWTRELSYTIELDGVTP